MTRLYGLFATRTGCGKNLMSSYQNNFENIFLISLYNSYAKTIVLLNPVFL